MALSYGFYDSYDGDRKYNTEQISSMFDGVIKDGVFDSIGEIFTTIPGDGMQVIIKTGKAWFDHTWLVNNAHYPLDLPMSDVTRNRVDAIVIETDHTVSIDGRKTSIKVISGTPAYNAQKPELVDTDFIKYHPIAYVTVKAGVSEITTSDIEIVVGKQECPFVTGILDSVAIDDLFNQWDENFQTFMTTKQTEWADYLQESTDILNNWISTTETAFNEWWSEVRTTLDTDTAAKLTQATIDNRNAIAAEITRATNKENDLQNQVNTKQNKITSTGLLKGDGRGGVVSATRGTDYDSIGSSLWNYQIITQTQEVKIPDNVINPIHVMMMGGGGSGSACASVTGDMSSFVIGGGGSGFFIDQDVVVIPGKIYDVVIGAGGSYVTALKSTEELNKKYVAGNDGNPTMFAGLIANGGKGAYYKEMNTESPTWEDAAHAVCGGDGSSGGNGYEGGNATVFGGGGAFGGKGGDGGLFGGGGATSGDNTTNHGASGPYANTNGPASFFFEMLWRGNYIKNQIDFAVSACGFPGYNSYGATSYYNTWGSAGGGGYFANGGKHDKVSGNATCIGGGSGGIGPLANNPGHTNTNNDISIPGGGGITIPWGSVADGTTNNIRHYGCGGNGRAQTYSNVSFVSSGSGSNGICIIFYRVSSNNI